MKPILIITVLLFGQLLLGQNSTVNYVSSTEDIVNPERGFYHYTQTLSSSPTPLDLADLIDRRSNFYTATGANYAVKSSLVFRYIVLDNFKASPISASFLNSIDQDFDVARNAGIKLIPRFAYTINIDDTNCTNGICPPYGDADKQTVLAHIAQLKPLLQKHGDVISAVQMGFIGIWGEQYYTDFFGDASQVGYISSSAWTDRNEVLTALLDAVPKNRMVQVRYPQIKQKLLYGNTASPDPAQSPPMTAAQAYTDTDIARIGFHNDCFLASNNDFGTFLDYDQNASNGTTEFGWLRSYMAADGAHTSVGGETCFENTETPADILCASQNGRADSDMQLFSYTYLNPSYNNAVNNNWVGQCMDEVKNKLGYRFHIPQGTYQNQVNQGEPFSVSMDITNDGFSALHNPRLAELVLEHTGNGKKYFGDLASDPRTWAAGTTSTVSYDFCTPNNMDIGQYRLYLHLADPQATLYDRPEYSIQLAHTAGWDPTTGYNDLMHTLTVNPNSSTAFCTDILDLREVPIITNIHATNIPDIHIYPNPVENYFMITGDLNPYTIEIIDVSGTVFQTLSGANNIMINTTTLPSGIYFVRLVHNNNANVYVQKIIKN